LTIILSALAVEDGRAGGANDSEVFPGQANRAKILPKRDDVFRVLYVGTVSVRKGIPYLLEAVRGLRLKNCECLLVGPIAPEMVPILRKYEGLYRHEGPIPPPPITT
jgi:glycosyltransferase involved in cell wall biosynthesis